jgi:hypothetical protein
MFMIKLLEVVFAFFLGAFTILAVGMYHFIKLFWIYILTAVVFASLFHSGIHNMSFDVSCTLGVGMTILMISALRMFSKK